MIILNFYLLRTLLDRAQQALLNMTTRTRRHTCWSVLLGACVLIGCSPKAPPISDIDRATGLIIEALSDWKAGASLDEQRSKTPPVYVAEELWLNGTTLENFAITEPAQIFGTNVRFGVKLTCIEKSGGKRIRDVKYLVTTSPALTIAREDG